jgi:hypothetical protein
LILLDFFFSNTNLRTDKTLLHQANRMRVNNITLFINIYIWRSKKIKIKIKSYKERKGGRLVEKEKGEKRHRGRVYLHTTLTHTEASPTPMALSNRLAPRRATRHRLYEDAWQFSRSLYGYLHMFGITDNQFMPSILLGVSLMPPSGHCWRCSLPRITSQTAEVRGSSHLR